MGDFFSILENKKVVLPNNAIEILGGCKSYKIFDSVEQLAVAAVGGDSKNSFEVKYELPNHDIITEAIIHRVKNGITANYTEAYMRRRDPDTMLIGDNLPTDKERFSDKMGYDFDTLRKETITWLQSQDLALFFYFAGGDNIGTGGIAIVPANAGFFAMGLAMLQQIIPVDELPEGFLVESAIYVAPTMSLRRPRRPSGHPPH